MEVRRKKKVMNVKRRGNMVTGDKKVRDFVNSCLSVRRVVLDKVVCLFSGDTVDVRDLVAEPHSEELLGGGEQFRTECRRHELRLVRQRFDHVCK